MRLFNRKSSPQTASPAAPVAGTPATAVNVPLVERTTFNEPGLREFYGRVMLGPQTLAKAATQAATSRRVVDLMARLEPDDYLRYLMAYFQRGLERFGDAWSYADITTVLVAVGQLLQPRSYLEIGVRRGRSLAVLGALCPECDLLGFDIWMPNYAGMANPGPELVEAELRRVGHRGQVELISGDSHQTVPQYLAQHPDAFFDAITIDGDHTEAGAEQDLRDTLDRVKIGGVVILDDICSPIHPYLGQVWRRNVGADPRFATYEYTELGYGVAFAIRRAP